MTDSGRPVVEELLTTRPQIWKELVEIGGEAIEMLRQQTACRPDVRGDRAPRGNAL